MTITANFPSIRPTLLLDFANTEVLDPRITFSRPTTATYYDAKTSAVAEQNLTTYSQAFSNTAGWTTGNLTVTGNATTAPDGTTTASLAVPDTTSNYHIVYNAPAITVASGSFTVSFYAKPSSYNFVYIRENLDGTYSNTFFNVSTGALGTVAAGRTATITASANGYYRCTVTVTATAGSRGFNFGVCSTDNTPVFTGDGTSGAYLWGAQIEQRSAVTAYNATTTTAITNYIPVLQTAATNTARFDHNPTTGESLGLLIEEQRTNLVTYSSDFSNVAWTSAASNVTLNSNTIIAPDGTLTGDTLISTITNGNHFLRQDISGLTNAATYTISLFAKAGGYNRFDLLGGFSSATGGAAFDLSTGTVTSGTGQISAVGNGWYRCSTQVVMSGTTIFLLIRGLTNAGAASFAGDGYSGVYIWGAQLEAGAFSTSYIPTVASQVTRSADSASMTGTNFSSWYNPSEGTLYAEAKTSSTADSIERVALQLLENGQDNFVIVGSYNGQGRVRVFDNGSNQATLSLDSVSGFYKITGTYKTNDVAGVVNGGTVSTDTSVTLASFNRLNTANIGLYYISSRYINGTIKKIAYYPIRVTNAQLQGLTG
jgi:hypothetical protein